MISVKVVADSYYSGSRLTTFELVYPRFIHSEVMTYGMFSRNSASSRAIPITKMIEAVETDPAMPVSWGKNRPGMSATEELEGEALEAAREAWLRGSRVAIEIAQELNVTGVHKQIANRVLEPYMWMQTVLSATEWANMYSQRANPAADPTFQALAEAMLAAHNASRPRDIRADDCWHTPYVSAEEFAKLGVENACKVSAVRCARTSYTNQGKVFDLETDLALFERLTTSGHWSPLEHVARSMLGCSIGKFRRFQQFRHMFEGENVIEFERLLDPLREEGDNGEERLDLENDDYV